MSVQDGMNIMFAKFLRAVGVAFFCSVAVAAWAKTPARPTPAVQPQAEVIQHIDVRGTQRIEPETVLTYIAIHEGVTYTEQAIDTALKTLYATGLFADVKMNFEEATATLTVHVVENP